MPDVAQLIIELADYLADEPLELRRAVVNDAGIELFAHAADETFAADAYAVIRAYGGGTVDATSGAMRVPVQVMTRAMSPAASLGLASSICGQLRDSAGRWKKEIELPTFRVLSVIGLQVPGLIGLDERGRAEASFNFDTVFSAAA